jgi:capsular polysaccharide transport system ATP-binding protein
MIELSNVTKYFQTNEGKKYILNDVSLIIPSGVNVGILGQNGAGKSTLMRMLGKIEFPNRGRINSQHTFSWPLAISGGFVGTMTGRANVKFVCNLYGKKREEKEEIINNVLAFTELESYFDMPIKTYSSGMRARLNFALSLMFDFDYLLIDETLSVGDSRFKQKSKDALMEKIQTCNVLLVSHQMDILQEVCDVGIVVHCGKLHYFSEIQDAIHHYEVINQLEH